MILIPLFLGQNTIPMDLPSSQSTDFSQDHVISTIGFLDLSKQRFNLFRLALRLEIPQGDLQAIEENFRNDLEACKLHTFLKWKERNGDEATWKKLIDAILEEGNKEFANNIIKNICECSYTSIPLCMHVISTCSIKLTL